MSNNTKPRISLQKRFAIMSIALLIIYSGVCLFIAYRSLGGITLNVNVLDVRLGSYKNQVLNSGNSFISGAQGTLNWKPESLWQSMVLLTIKNNNVDFLDIAGLIIMAIIIYFMFKDSRDGAVFTKSMKTGFTMVIIAIGLTTMFADIIRTKLAINYIPVITHGQFRGNYQMKVLSYDYLVYSMLLFLTLIPERGLKLQQETEFTI